MMRVAIRADASVDIGTGHVMRCLALAASLKKQGAESIFLCRESPGNLCGLLESQGFFVCRLPYGQGERFSWEDDADLVATNISGRWGSVDWMVVDHYHLDSRWEAAVSAVAARLLAIDDIADRPHACDLLLDQNLQTKDNRYAGLLKPGCKCLLGPEYALLRDEFRAARACVAPRSGELRNLLVFFGGSDPTNQTAKALDALALVGRKALNVDIVVGASNPHGEEIRRRCEAMSGVRFHCQVPNMAELMARADLALGAGGSATWERCCLGLPALAVVLADNQIELTKAAENAGVLVDLGWGQDLSPGDFADALDAITPERIMGMSRCGMRLVDGEGASCVAQMMN